METSSDVKWPEPIWQEINDAVVKEVAKVRTAQKVFPTTVLDNDPTEVQNDVILFDARTGEMSIKEGQTKSFVEIYQEFSLTSAQVSKEAQLKTCKSLARMAAKALALAEDTILFQGKGAKLQANVKAEAIDTAGDGLLGVANPKDADDNNPTKVTVPIDVTKAVKPKPGVIYGENVFAKVTEAIAKLTDKAQAPKFALLLPTAVFADTFAPPGDQSLVTTAERIKPLVEGGFYGTGTLPPDKGLLVALAGDPTTLSVGREAKTEFIRKDGTKYVFKVSERFQFVARDARSMVLLNFK